MCQKDSDSPCRRVLLRRRAEAAAKDLADGTTQAKLPQGMALHRAMADEPGHDRRNDGPSRCERENGARAPALRRMS